MRQYVVFSILIISGLIAIAVQQSLGSSHWLYPYLSQLASILLVSGSLSILYKRFVDRAQQAQLASMLDIRQSILDSGLAKYHSSWKDYKFENLLSDPSTLTLVLSDGQKWIGNHMEELSARFSCETETELFLIDPLGPFLPVMAGKVGRTEEEYRQKIERDKDLIKEAWSKAQKTGELKIFALKNFPPHALYCSAHTAAVTPYQISSERSDVPLFVYNSKRRNGRFQQLMRDVELLRRESQVVFDSRRRS